MTTHALMELADRLSLAADAWTDRSHAAVSGETRALWQTSAGLLTEAATQLRTAAAEGGGEPLGYIRDSDAAFLKEKFAGQCTVLINQKPQNKKALAIYTHPPIDSGAGRDGCTHLREVAKRNLRSMIEHGSTDKKLMLTCLEELS